MMDFRESGVRLEIDSGHFRLDLEVSLPVCIGSAPTAGIRWAGSGLEPRHCEVYRAADEIYVRTLSPTSTLTVNYREITKPASLHHHDVIGLGQVNVRLLLSPNARRPARSHVVTEELRTPTKSESVVTTPPASLPTAISPMASAKHSAPMSTASGTLMLALDEERVSRPVSINAGALESLQIEPRQLRKP